MGGLVLLVFGLLIVRAALLPTPDLDQLLFWQGTIESVALESLPGGKDSQTMLRVGLDGPERAFFVHNKSGELKALQEQLPIGAPIDAWVEPHARQVLVGTPFARGHTEAWQLAVSEGSNSGSSSPAELLVSYKDSAARRRQDRARWAFAGGAALLIGLFGFFQGRGRKSTKSPSSVLTAGEASD